MAFLFVTTLGRLYSDVRTTCLLQFRASEGTGAPVPYRFELGGVRLFVSTNRNGVRFEWGGGHVIPPRLQKKDCPQNSRMENLPRQVNFAWIWTSIHLLQVREWALYLRKIKQWSRHTLFSFLEDLLCSLKILKTRRKKKKKKGINSLKFNRFVCFCYWNFTRLK